MPIIRYLRAAQDYPAEGIAKGDWHYRWHTRMGFAYDSGKVINRSLIKPRPSQLTISPYFAEAYALREVWEDQLAKRQTPAGYRQALEDLQAGLTDLDATVGAILDNLDRHFPRHNQRRLITRRRSQLGRVRQRVDRLIVRLGKMPADRPARAVQQYIKSHLVLDFDPPKTKAGRA